MRRTVVLLGTLAAGFALAVTAATRAEQEPDEILDGGAVRDLLAVLESEALRHTDYCDLREEALKQLGRLFEKGGDRLRETALQRIRERTGEDRKRAQILLAQVEDLPATSVRPLLDAEDIEVSTWAWLVLADREGLDPPLLPLELHDDPQAADPGQPFERDPLLDVEEAIRAKVGQFAIVDGVAMTSRDDGEDERWEYEIERRTLDLDGDGVAEHCVVASHCPLGFAVVLRRTAEDHAWEIASLEQSQFISHARPFVADLDGDGHPDLALQGWFCSNPSLGFCMAYSVTQREFVEGPLAHQGEVRVLRRRPGEPAVLVGRTPHFQNHGGTAIHLSGMCAWQYELVRWTGREMQPVGSAYVR